MEYKDPVIDVTPLYHLVQNWYQLHPGTSIPLDAWARKLEKYEIQKGDSISITTPEYKIEFENSVLIPVFAAISLDATTEELSKVIAHHGAKIHDLRYSTFSISEQLDAGQHIKARCHLKPIGLYHVTQRMVDAMASHPELLAILKRGIENQAVPPPYPVTAALLKNGIEELWPITRIEQFFNDFEITNEWKPLPAVPTLEVFGVGFERVSDFSDTEIMEMLRRASIFNPRTCRDNGFTDSFLRVVFNMAMSSNDVAQRIIDALNGTDNDIEKPEIISKLIAVFSECNDYVRAGDTVTSYLFKLLDAEKYNAVLNSLVLRLNLSPKSILSEINEFPDIKKIENVKPEGLLTALGEELMDLHPRDMRWHHFRSLEKASQFEVEQAVDASTLTRLIARAVSGYERHTRELRITDTPEVKKVTSSSIGAFLTYALKLADPDYQQLSTLDSASKAILVSHGFDMKQLAPGMSNQDKGKVLCEGLGL